MANLDDLLAALGKVASAYNGDDDERDPNDDNTDIPGDEVPDDQDVDEEEGEDDDEERDDDFSKPNILKTVMLLQRLESEAEEKYRLDRKHKAIALRDKSVSRADANIDKIAQLQRKTREMKFELESNRMLAAETKRNQEAALALYRSNLTPAQREERDEDARRMAIYSSQFCKEAHPQWREHAAMEFKAKGLVKP